MTSGPFEDPDAHYRVLVNGDGQYSLWPSFAAVPAGWQVVYALGSREACLKHIADTWTDMRPNALRITTRHPKA